MRGRTWIAPALAGVIALVLSLSFIRTGSWSVYDEYTHFDYVVKVAEGFRLPPVSDVMGETAFREAVCTKAPGFGVLSAQCTAQTVDPTTAPYGGQSTATAYLPTYYVITGLGAGLIHALPGDLTWIESSRLMGALYLAIAAMLVVMIARRLGASSLVALSAGVLIAAVPMTLQQFSTVNNDALSVVFSLAAVYAFLRMRESSIVARSLVAFALAFLAMTVKETALIAVFAVFVLSARDVLVRTEGRVLGLVRVVASAGVVVVAANLLRSIVYPRLVGQLPDNGLQNAEILRLQGTPPINLVAANALRESITALQVPQGALANPWFTLIAQMLVILAFGLPLAAIFRITRRGQWRSTPRLLSATLLIFIPIFIAGFLAMLKALHGPLFFQSRYLLPTVVLAVAVAASFIKPVWGRVTLVVSLAFAAWVLVTLLQAPQWTG